MNEQNNGVFVQFSKPMKTDFRDGAGWELLCDKTRYILPDWSVSPTKENIRIWLNRLEIKEADYMEAMQTNIEDMIALNPTWPLRAFVGLLLEFKFIGTPEAA